MAPKNTRDRITKFKIAPILEQFGFHLAGRRTGRQKVKCQFHQDDRASGSVDYNANRYVCFACAVSGDAVDLLRLQLGLSFHEAVERAKSLTGQGSGQICGEPAPGETLFD